MLTLGIPTRGRRSELNECMATARALAHEPIRVVLLFGDDREEYDFWRSYEAFENRHLFLSEPRRYYYHDVNYLYRLIRDETPHDNLIVISNDDNKFIVDGWDEIATEIYREKMNSRGVLSFWQHPLHTYMTSISYTEEVWDGWLAPEDYLFYFGDSERHQDLMERGEWAQVREPLIWHPMEAQTDPEATHSYKAWYERDKRVYEKRMAQKAYIKDLENALSVAQRLPRSPALH